MVADVAKPVVVLTAADVVLLGTAVVELPMRGAAVVALDAEDVDEFVPGALLTVVSAFVASVAFIVDEAFVVEIVSLEATPACSDSVTLPEVLAVAFAAAVTSPEPLPVCNGIVELPDDPFTAVLLTAPSGTPESEEFASSAGM